ERIDFSGYGASIFSNWLNESANFGAVSQVKFDVLIGRTAHEVIQIKSILFPWGVPVVRSIVIQRKNTGIVTRYDSGWVAQGPGVFNFLSNNKNANEENNPYTFHPGMVKGIFNVTEIKDTPSEMDIQMSPAGVNINFSGVHFNGDIEIENIVKGALPKKEGQGSRTHSAGQFGYVMLADASKFNDNTKLMDIFPSHGFKELLNNSKLGGNLGGPVNALIDIGGTGQKIQATRVDVSANKGPNESFIVAVKGTVELPKEGSWAVVKCLPSKAVIPVAQNEAVPIIRNGILSIHRENDIVSSKTEFGNSNYCIGDPFEIDNYVFGAPAPQLQYSLLQSTDAQKLLFRRPSFTQNEPKIHTEIPDLADAFRLLNCKAIFPDLSKTLSLPDKVTSLNIVGDGSGLKFDQSFFEGADNLNDFVPRQLTNDPATQEFELLNESGLQIIICYGSKGENPSPSAFKVDLSSDAVADALDAERKRWETVNKDVAIKVNLGDIKPLLKLRGTFRSEAGKDPEFENPQCELGDELKAVKDILQILALLAGKGQNDTLKVVMGNSPGVYNYKMSIDQNIPVIQFPSVEEITLTTPPLLIIE
ncbi:MAG: hypothetical protein ABI091_05135, partial [Ferruginibacter sp.]